MVQRIILSVFALAALAGCSSLRTPVLDADGCRPAMALYQPAVGPGGAGQVIHIPRSCPSRITSDMIATPHGAGLPADVARDLGVRQSGPNPPPIPPAPSVPPEPVSADVAIRNGIEGLCGWFFGDQPYSLEGLRQAAFDAHYGRGAPVSIVPLPEMLREMSFSAVGFTAMIADAPSEAHGVAAFVSFHNPVCQIQVHGYEAEATTALAQLEADGWRKVGTSVRNGVWEAQRYQTTEETGKRMTLVDNRVTDPTGTTLRHVLNVVPGHDSERGALD